MESRFRALRTDNQLISRNNTVSFANSLLITGASQMLTFCGRAPRRGSSLSNLGLIKNGALLVRDGAIAAVGAQAQVEALAEARAAEKLDLGGRVALPKPQLALAHPPPRLRHRAQGARRF